MGNISGAPHEVLFCVMNAVFTVQQNSASVYKCFVFVIIFIAYLHFLKHYNYTKINK